MNATLAKLPVLAATLLLIAGCASNREHQSVGDAVDDATITARVKTALAESPAVKAYQVDVETFGGVVQLNGFVDSTSAKNSATTVARNVSGVREVRNNLSITSGTETVGEAVDDTVITGKVKAALIADPLTKASQINVSTENGIVQLAGFVDSAAEKQQAGELARSVASVRGVRNELDVKSR